MNRKGLDLVGSTGAIVVAVTVLIGACADLETPVAVFSSYEDAAKKGAIGPGKWLPSWLPKTATDIHEAHNIDTNLVWLEFKGTNSLGGLNQQCRLIEDRSIQVVLPNLTSGFPRSMHDSKDLLRRATEIDAVRCEDADVRREWIAARRLGSDVVYAWTLSN